MSCFSVGSSNPPTTATQAVDAKDFGRVTYEGLWNSKLASQFMVSEKDGDKATFIFLGTSVQVFGQINSRGMKALFGIDLDGNDKGGITCSTASTSLTSPPNVLLFDSSQHLLQQGQHTLVITNNGDPLSLDSFKVFGGNGPATSTLASHPVVGPSMPTLPSTSVKPPPNGTDTPTSDSPSSVSGSTPPGGGTNLSSTSLTLPLPVLTSRTSSYSIPQTTTASTGAETEKSKVEGSLSYRVSSYTEVSISGGRTTTIVIATTVEVLRSQPYRGPSRGAVAGAAVGGVLFLFVLIGLGLWWWRRRRNCVRFLHGISNLDFDSAMMTRSSAELQSQGPRVRDSDGTLYGGVLPQYKLPESYSSLALDLTKPPPSEYATSGISGDRRLTAYTEPSTRSPSVRSLCDKHSVSGPQSVEPVVPLSKDEIL